MCVCVSVLWIVACVYECVFTSVPYRSPLKISGATYLREREREMEREREREIGRDKERGRGEMRQRVKKSVEELIVSKNVTDVR